MGPGIARQQWKVTGLARPWVALFRSRLAARRGAERSGMVAIPSIPAHCNAGAKNGSRSRLRVSVRRLNDLLSAGLAACGASHEREGLEGSLPRGLHVLIQTDNPMASAKGRPSHP